MRETELYYRFQAVGIDVTDEKEVKKYNEPLTSFSVLERQFSLLETAYNDKLKQRADIIVNALPEVQGVAELAVYHNIKFKLFSKEVKKQCFSLCATYFEQSGASRLYFYDSHDIQEVRRIFEDFTNEGKIPDFSVWKCVYTG